MTRTKPTLKSLGFTGAKLERMKKALNPSTPGTVFIAGRTGSGKTITGLAVLDEVQRNAGKILFAENHLRERELYLKYIKNLTAVPLGVGVALAEYGLNTHPDNLDSDFVYDTVVFGELYNAEMAKIALLRGASQGSSTFASLHANSAAEALQRLSFFSERTYSYVAKGTKAVVTQRLIKELCDCKEPQIVESRQLAILGLPDDIFGATNENLELYSKKGCSNCYYSGYKGRFAVHEILFVDETIEALLINKASSSKIEEEAKKSGMITLVEDTWQQVKAGRTSVSELLREFPEVLES